MGGKQFRHHYSMDKQMQIELRDYQQETIDALIQWCKDNPNGNPVLELPTGSGKSVIIAEFCRQMAKRGRKVLVLCRQKELVLQNKERFTQLAWGDYTVGIYCAGLGQKDVEHDVTFATVQSVAGKTKLFGQLAAILVDEAHQIPASSNSQYGSVIADAREGNPKCRLIGLTATPYRTSSGLVYGEGAIFDDCAHSVPVSKMLETGNITPWRTPEVHEVDVSGVTIRGNEFDLNEMGAEFGEKLDSNVEEILAASKDRKKVLIFATTVKHGEALKEAIIMATGQRACLVTGESNKVMRETTLDLFCDGPLKYLVNVGVLTTGFDCPSVDIVAVCRATQSAGLFYQIIGRGMRKAEGKEDFLVLDFGGNFDRLGDPRDPNYGRGEKAPERVLCPSCSELAMKEDVRCGSCGEVLRTRTCPSCLNDSPADAKKCKAKTDPEDLFAEECGFDFTLRRCNSMERGDRCLVVLGDGEDICPVCGAAKEKRVAGEFEAKCKKAKKKERSKWEVTDVEYHYHRPKDPNKRPTLRVNYTVIPQIEGASMLDKRRFQEWVTIEHEGWVRAKAVQWWQSRSQNDFPDTVDEAVLLATGGALREPSTITTEPDGKWTRIVGADFELEKPDRIYIEDEEPPF